LGLLIKLLDTLTPYGTHSYLAMFAILIACGFGFPMPEDIILITGGILAARGVTDLMTTHVVCFAGVIIGDCVVYWIGRKFGPTVKSKSVFKKIFTPERDAKVAAIFRRYGDKVIFMARFMPGLRMPVFLTAGTWQVPPWKFLALDGSAALISVPIWILIGHAFGSNLEELESFLSRFQVGFYAVLALIIAILVVFAVRRQRKSNT